jgi:hypothetical protein
VREAIKKVRELRAEGKDKDADAILRGLSELYRGDTRGQRILKGD